MPSRARDDLMQCVTRTIRLAALFVLLTAGIAVARQPNVVIIFTDDQGYQDLGCFGSPNIKTPRLDRMAAEGRKFTSFYVAAPSCSPSRAALMTGCYPKRVGILNVLFPSSEIGLHPDEYTLADMFKSEGYATACVGKWHLGHDKQFLPMRQGFDEYFGLPYSNDMNIAKAPLPLIEGEEAIEIRPDQRQLTKRYTQRAVAFIENHKAEPFFLYLPHSMPHVPLFASDDFRGKSERGLYGDVIEEIDWSVGEILDTIDQLGITRDTLVIFTSDNGPWLQRGDHGGSALPLREGKGSVYEGGMRVPCIMRWPSRIPAGTSCNELSATIDMLPTLAGLIGAKLPSDRVIDGHDISPLLFEDSAAKTPHDFYCYYKGETLLAMRSGRWKIHFAQSAIPEKKKEAVPLQLYDLEQDISEQLNLADEHPEIVKRLEGMGRAFDEAVTRDARPAGTL